ncbi:MAG: ABC transporter permease, partial [Prolixibacteraceae bacterium]
DMEVLKQKVPDIDLLAPRLEPWGGGTDNNVVRGEETAAFSIKGDYPEFQFIDPINLLEGRFINDIDIKEKRKVCVIGDRVKEVMFKNGENPIGEYLKIKGVYFQVVGVFEPKNKNINFGGDKSETIHLPFTTLQQAWNFGDIVHWFAVTAQPNIPVSEVEKKCMKILADRNSIHPDDEQAFGHFNLEERFKQMTGLFFGIHFLIWLVGTGTLMAGVIGVSNIMLIIVKERTREIGIQRALGATPGKVIGQIITESVFLTSIAGYIGMLFGIMVIEGINFAMEKSGGEANMFKNPGVDFSIAVIALFILVISGVFAGLIPARRAVSIKPIDAIRSE